MFRPPAREICLDALEEVYQNCKPLRIIDHFPFQLLTCSLDEESRPSAGKVLSRWRPQRIEQLLEEQTTLVNRTVEQQPPNASTTNGTKDPRTAHLGGSQSSSDVTVS